MQFRKISESPTTYVLILAAGDEIAATLKAFAERHELKASSFKAIGALQSVTLDWFDPQTKAYRVSVELDEQVELASMIGDVGRNDGEVTVHAHVSVGRSDGSACAGHLVKAVVRPTCEIFLTEYATDLEKKTDPQSGLALFDLSVAGDAAS